MKNNSGFRFGIPKNIEIDIIMNIKYKLFQLNYLNFAPFLGALFWSSDEADLKNNNRFGFGTPKNKVLT